VRDIVARIGLRSLNLISPRCYLVVKRIQEAESQEDDYRVTALCRMDFLARMREGVADSNHLSVPDNVRAGLLGLGLESPPAAAGAKDFLVASERYFGFGWVSPIIAACLRSVEKWWWQ
jgi:hypothetical protein